MVYLKDMRNPLVLLLLLLLVGKTCQAKVSYSDIDSGRLDGVKTNLIGSVRDVFCDEIDKRYVFLVLSYESRSLFCPIPAEPGLKSRLEAFIGHRVSITGIFNPGNTDNRLYTGHLLRIEHPDDIRLLQSPESDVFASTPPLEDLWGTSPAVIASLDRRKVHGRILASWDSNKALLKRPNGTITNLETTDKPPQTGDFVEAIGFPETDLFRINLCRVIWRSCQPLDVPPVASANITAQDILNGGINNVGIETGCHGMTIQLTGIVRSLPDAKSSVLSLESQSFLVPVNVSPAPDVVRKLTVGCQISARGTCVMDIDNWRPNAVFPHIRGFSLIVHEPDDIIVLSRPSWWTTRRLLSVIGTLLALLVSILVWNAALRKVAVRKGRELFREQLGHVKADLRTEERTRLAVELHDTLAQNLTGVSMEIEAANDLRGNAPQPMLDHLGIAAKALKSCRDELRNCLWDLRNQALEEPDMTKAALKTLQPVVNDSRLAVRFNVPRTRLSDNTAHAILRIVRELVVNAIRHGNASSVKVAGTIDGDKLLCSVTDDGCGFDPDAAPGILQGHFGLQGIQERIDVIGGTFEISSTPGKGTKATISVPIPHEH